MGNQRRGRGGGGEEDLHAAARSGDLTAVQLIVSSNPLTVNTRDKHSRTAYPFSLFMFFNSIQFQYRNACLERSMLHCL